MTTQPDKVPLLTSWLRKLRIAAVAPHLVGRRELTASAAKAGLQVDEFHYFMLAANQLLVLSRRGEDGSSARA
jgi:hypothetical protein